MNNRNLERKKERIFSKTSESDKYCQNLFVQPYANALE